MEDIFLGEAEPLIREFNLGLKDVDEVVGNDNLLLLYPESYEQFKAMVDRSIQMGIKESFRELRDGTNVEYRIVVRRS